MSPSSGNCSKPHRFIARLVSTALTTMPTTFLATICLAAFVMLLNSSCSPTPTPHPQTTPTPMLLPPVTLEEPEDDSCVECGSELILCWNHVRELLAGEYYRLQVWVTGGDPSVFYHKEKRFTLPNLLPSGEYNWAVAIVRRMGPDTYEQVSEESERHHFHVVPPFPVANSISPTSTLQGTAVPVLVSGENFTTSTALTIGVPLQVTFVDSSTITATVPGTLGAGVYTVTVRDSMGRGVTSTVFFTVTEPPTPTATPTRPPIITVSPTPPPIPIRTPTQAPTPTSTPTPRPRPPTSTPTPTWTPTTPAPEPTQRPTQPAEPTGLP